MLTKIITITGSRLKISVVEPHHFYEALAAPAPSLLYTKPTL
jgi:hypothetical protein